ncbi:MAG: hypothetical protein WC488_02910 [Candidatus Micrarchaeia archaeon]
MNISKSDELGMTKSYQFLVLSTFEKLGEAHASQDKWKYFSYFRTDLEMLKSRLDPEDQQTLNEDFQTLKRMLRDIAQDPSLNPDLKKKMTLELQENFADEHRFYIQKAFPKVGIQKPEQEGTMDYSKHDIDQLAQIIRAGSASKSVLERVMSRSDGGRG